MMNRKELREEKIRRRKVYNKMYATKILPTIDEFENFRRKQLLKLILSYFSFISLSSLLIFIIYAYFAKITSTIPDWPVIGIVIALLILIFYTSWIKYDYSTTVKQKYANDILSLFDNIAFTEKSFTDKELEESSLFAEFNERRNDDLFIAKYKNSEILISEILLQYVTRSSKGSSNTIVFNGVIVSFTVNKNFNGNTIIAGKYDSTATNSSMFSKMIVIMCIASILWILFATPYGILESIIFIGMFILLIFAYSCRKKKNFQKINLEDPEIMKTFSVSTTGSQVEARYLLTPAFIHRFKTLKNAFGNKPIKCAFYDNKIMLAISTSKDLFEIGSIYKSLKNPDSFYKFYCQISAIFDMVEHLKMYDDV